MICRVAYKDKEGTLDFAKIPSFANGIKTYRRRALRYC